MHIADRSGIQEDHLDHLISSTKIRQYRNSLDTKLDCGGGHFLNFISSRELVVLNGAHIDDFPGQFTFLGPHGSSVIDYMLVDIAFLSSFEFSFYVMDSVSSCHQPLVLTVDCIIPRISNKIFYHYGKIVWNKDLSSSFLEWIQQIEIDVRFWGIQGRSFSMELKRLMLTFFEEKDACLPPGQGRPGQRHHKPWFDVNCKRAKGFVCRALHAYKARPSPATREIFVEARNKYKQEQSLARYNFVNTLAHDIETDKSQDRLWEAVGRLTRGGSSAILPPMAVWDKHFSNLYASSTMKPSRSQNLAPLFDEDLDGEILMEEIEWAVQKLKAGGAPGPDAFPPGIWKEGGTSMLKILVEVFNQLLQVSVFPCDWYEGWILPIFKKGDRKCPGNYRPIALLNSLPKLFSSILARRLSGWQRKHGVLPLEQAGFQAGQSCSDQAYILSTLVSQITGREDRRIYAAFMDLTAAFDSVPHHLLWAQLRDQGVSGHFVDLLRAAYSSASIRVKLPSGPGSRIPVGRGVLQGDPLSPILFNAYIYDVFKFLDVNKAVPVQLGLRCLQGLAYADDIVLLACSNRDLRKKITLFNKYCGNLGLEINCVKSKILVFRNSVRLQGKPKFSIRKTPLEMVKKFTYLGFLLDDKNIWGSISRSRKEQAQRALSQATRILASLRISSLKVQMTLYGALCKSVLLYGAEIWFPLSTVDLEVAQNNFFRRVYGLPRTTSGAVIRREFNAMPVMVGAWMANFRYWISVLERTELPLLAVAYELDCQYPDRASSWAGRIKGKLDRLGLGYVWLSQDPVVAKGALPLILQRLIDAQRCEDVRSLESGKNRFYSRVNDPGESPSYWNVDLPFRILRFWAQLRTVGIPLGWRNLRVLDLGMVRECPLCRCVVRPKLSLYHLMWSCDVVSLPPWPVILQPLVDLDEEEFGRWLRNPPKQQIVAFFNRATEAMSFLSCVFLFST